MTRRRLLAPRVLEYCRNRALLAPGDRVLAAVSGGADSVVLLHVLQDIRGALDLHLVVGHVDHGLRRDSGEDAAFVEDLARDLGLPFLSRQVCCAAPGRSLEEMARERRYEALQEMAREAGASRIATGHTATDQAETVILRMVRGSGPLGLAAILPATREGVVRPLLCATREEVGAYARERGLRWREDPTNRDSRFLRNRVRVEVMPALRALNPRIDFALAALAEDLAAWPRAEVSVGPAQEVRLPLEPALPPPLRAWQVREAWVRLTGSIAGLSRAHLEAVERLLAATVGPAEVHLPRRVVARREPGALRLWREPEDRPPPGSRRRPPRPPPPAGPPGPTPGDPRGS